MIKPEPIELENNLGPDAVTATMFIVCSVMGGIALMIFGTIKLIGG